MKNKKGQLTLFIIIGILIVVGGIIYFVLRDSVELNNPNLNVDEINAFVLNCIKKTGEETIFELGKSGGYFIAPDPKIYPNIPVYYDKAENNFITVEEMEEEISFLMEKKLFFCTKNFVNFPNFEITQREINIDTSIDAEKIYFDVDYPITIKKSNETTRLKNFEVEIPSNLGKVYDAVNEFMKEQMKQEGICLTCLLELSLINDLYIKMNDYDDETTIFIFEDKNYKKGEETFKYVFANRY
jgi:hypothetical protein